jgi:hypothetical protein
MFQNLFVVEFDSCCGLWSHWVLSGSEDQVQENLDTQIRCAQRANDNHRKGNIAGFQPHCSPLL